MKWAAASSGALTLISSTSFNSSASHSVNDVFSSTYQNYKILINIDSTSQATGINFRYRVSGADDSSNAYYKALIYNASNAATPTGDSTNPGTTWGVGYMVANGSDITSVITCTNPFETKRTGAVHQTVMWYNTYTQQAVEGMLFSNTTSFTGFTIYTGAGTMTGKVRVYGLAN